MSLGFLWTVAGRLSDSFLYYFTRFSLYQRLYCARHGVFEDCGTAGHRLFAQRIGESAERLWAVSQRSAYPLHSRTYYWCVHKEEQRCLLLAFHWHPELSMPSAPSAPSAHASFESVYAHWLFYADGLLYHSCILSPDNSRDKRTIIAFAERKDQLDAGSRLALDRLAQQPNCQVSATIADEISSVVKRVLLQNPDFSSAIDRGLFEPRLSLVHRTFLPSELPKLD